MPIPPPHEQLGYLVQDSINADPTNLARVLREDPALPFQDLESVDSSHLTVGPAAPKVCLGCVGFQAVSVADNRGKLEAWATIPVILISLMIGALVFLFFGRRLWKRHREVGPDTEREMRTKDFAVSELDMTKEKDGYAMAGLVEETTEEGDCSRTSSEKKKKNKKRKKQLIDRSTRTDASDTSELSGYPHAEEEDSSSSSSSEDESEEARRRRRRRERKSKRAHQRSVRSDPPSLEDLRREKQKKKRRSSKRRARSRD
ncbi:hypothetical protein HJC23_013315 [Cyclotella cryptica]|uniref:Uncharacterized protein n=1 Tax=Cyclotella cryptica TaxID=29204 RepID=A0ABD3Q093_9STRA